MMMAATPQDPPQDAQQHHHDDNDEAIHYPHLVIPGQVIASTTSDSSEQFLRGHGTYLPEETDDDNNNDKILRASVTGTVQRVNQLITVDSVALNGGGRLAVGDLVVGRISSVFTARWTVRLSEDDRGLQASLPLSGVALPDQKQRIRTSADAWDMRSYLQPGDMVAAEVHQIKPGAILLHARSGHGKLGGSGWGVTVPSRLVVRRKTHVVSVCGDRFQVLLGCNGWIWLQKNPNTTATAESGATTTTTAAAEDTETVLSPTDRRDLARLVNAVTCLRETRLPITPEALEAVVKASQNIPVSHMVWPEHIIELTASLRGGS